MGSVAISCRIGRFDRGKATNPFDSVLFIKDLVKYDSRMTIHRWIYV
jgi:hypothetical protein